MSHRTVIGLEIHVQLKTRTKAFCPCAAAFGAPANSNVCPVCLGYPGALPVLNLAVVLAAVRLALALGCQVHAQSRFARKSYFYPDLAKGYQITQYEEPLATGGALPVPLAPGEERQVPFERLHIEEDSARSVHDPVAEAALLDFNRAGVPLVELVTEPVLGRPEEAAAFLRQLRGLVRWLGVSDGNMEEGSLRCDANISVAHGHRSGRKVEIKNLNSFRHVEQALTFEATRQREVVADGGSVVAETRLWDERRRCTEPVRTKEEAGDYRYFPEPDLGAVVIDEATLAAACNDLPELPWQRCERWVDELGLGAADAAVLVRERAVADYFDAAVAASDTAPGTTARLVLGELMAMRKAGSGFPVDAGRLAGLVELVAGGRVTGPAVKEVLARMAATGASAAEVVAQHRLASMADEGELEPIVAGVVAREPELARRCRQGEERLVAHFVGQVMRATRGRAEPAAVNRLLRRALDVGR